MMAMAHKNTHTKETKEKFILLRKQGASVKGASRELGIPHSTCVHWDYSIRAFGEEYFLDNTERRGTTRYSDQTKEAAVQDLLAGDSFPEVMKRYHVMSAKALISWERAYTGKKGYKKIVKKDLAKRELVARLRKAGWSMKEIAKELGCSVSSVNYILANLEHLGEYEFLNNQPYANISEELRQEITEKVLSGELSVSEAARCYRIKMSTIKNWVY